MRNIQITLAQTILNKANSKQEFTTILKQNSDFEQLMLLVGEHTNQDLNEITTFRFYNLLDYIKSKQ